MSEKKMIDAAFGILAVVAVISAVTVNLESTVSDSVTASVASIVNSNASSQEAQVAASSAQPSNGNGLVLWSPTSQSVWYKGFTYPVNFGILVDPAGNYGGRVVYSSLKNLNKVTNSFEPRYSMENGIYQQTSKDTFFNWRVPMSVFPGTYSVVLQDKNYTSGPSDVESLPFKIQDPVQIYLPNNSTVWHQGEPLILSYGVISKPQTTREMDLILRDKKGIETQITHISNGYSTFNKYDYSYKTGRALLVPSNIPNGKYNVVIRDVTDKVDYVSAEFTVSTK